MHHRHITTLVLLLLLLLIIVASSGTALVTAQAPPAPLAGHTGAVASAVYSPDGQLIVSGSFDRTIKIWNASTGAELRTLNGHAGQVLTVAVAPNGRQFASGARDNTVKLWDLYIPTPLQQFAGHTGAVHAVLAPAPVLAPEVPTWSVTAGADKLVKMFDADGKLLRDLVGHEALVTRLALKPDRSLLASGDANGVVRLWLPLDGAPQIVLGADTTPIRGLAFHPSTNTMLTAAENGSVKMWTLPMQATQTLAGHTLAVTAVTMSADGKRVVTGGADAGVKIFNGADGKLVKALTGQVGPVSAVTLHDATGLIATGNDTGVIKTWNEADGAELLTLNGHTGAIHDVRTSAKGDTLVSSGDDGSIRIWRLPVAATPLAGSAMPVLAVSLSNDGKLVATGSADKSIRLYNFADGAAVRTLAGSAAAVRSIDFRADNTQLASTDDVGNVYLWDPAQVVPQAVLSGHVGPATSLTYLPDGKTLISTGDDGTLRWWSLPLVPAKPLAGNAAVHRVVKSTSGNELVVGGADGVIRVITAATAAVARPLAGHVGPVTALATGGTIVASGDAQGNIRLWTLATGVALPTIAAHDDAILGLAIDAKGTQLASVGEDGAVRIWKVPVAVKPLNGSAIPVTISAFSADGSLVAAAGAVGGKATIVVRDTVTGAVKSTLVGHTAAITSLAFSVDKTKLVSGSADKTTRVWNIAAAQGVELAQSTLEAAVGAVALSPDSLQAFAGAANGVLRQWTVADGEETRLLAGHAGAINSLQVSGATLISGGTDTTVRLWNLANGAAIRSIAHAAPVMHVAVSGNGSMIASAGADKLVKLWNAANGAPLAVLTGHTDAVRQVSFHSDGTQVLSASADGLRVWDVAGVLLERFPLGEGGLRGTSFGATGLVLAMDAKHVLHVATPTFSRLISGHVGPVNSLAFAPSGATIATAGSDKTVRLWSVTDGKPMATFAGPTGAVAEVAISSDGKLIAAAGADKVARVWPLPAQVTAAPIPPQSEFTHATAIHSVTFSPDNSRLAAGLELPANTPNTPAAVAVVLPTVSVWDLSTGRILERLAAHTGSVVDVEFLADNVTVVSGSIDKSTLFRTLAATRVVVGAEGKIANLSLTTDGTQLATSSEDKKIKIWNTATGAMLFEVAMGAVTPTTVAIRGDKLQLAAAGSDNKLYLWPLTGQAAGAVVNATLPAAVVQLQYNADGTKLATTSANKQLRVYDPTDASLLESIATTEVPVAVHFSPDGETLAAGAGNAALLQPLSLLRRLLGHEGAVTAAVFVPDGTSVISGGADKTIRQWTLADGKQVRTFTGATAAITSIAISGDGATLVAGSLDKFVRTWSLAAGPAAVAPALSIEHASPVQSASVNADGTRVSTAADDGVIRIWDVVSGRELQHFTGHEGPTLAVALSADGKTVVSGGADKSGQLSSIAVSNLFVAAPTNLTDAAFLSNGSAIATSGSDKQVKLWDAAGKPVRQLAGATVELTRLAIRGDGLQIAAADAQGRLLLWNAADGVLQQTVETGAVIHDLAYSPDHLRIAVAGADNHLRVFQTADGESLQDQVAAAPLLAVRFSASGRELLTGSADNSVSVWAYASPTPVANLAGHTGPVLSMAYSGNGTLLASTSSDGTIRTWNLETNQAVRSIAGHMGAVYATRFTSDDSQIVSCGADGTVRLWTVANGAAVRQMTIETAEGERPPGLYDVVISPNNQQAYAAGHDGVIRLWNLANGQPGTSIQAGPAPAYRLEFLPNNQLLAAGHAGNLTIWNPANATQVSVTKIPGIPYSAAVSPVAKHAAIPCADGKTYVVALP